MYRKKSILYFLLLHTSVLILRIAFVVFGFTDLQSEEAQYWLWSKQLDWSYYSKPPLVAFLNFLSTSVLGDTELGVRINAILIGFFIALITYLFTEKLFRCSTKAFWASMLVYAMPFYHGTSLFFSTDSPLILFWLLASYLGWCALESNRTQTWLLLGVVLGLGYLSKYAMLFFIPSWFLFLLLTQEKNQWKNKKMYLSFLLSFFFFLPVIIWNIDHDFIGFRHLNHLSGATEQPNPFGRRMLKLADYMGGQLAIVSPLFLLFYYRLVKNYLWTRRSREMMYLLLPAILVYVVFIVVALTRRSGANVNWTMFAYTGLPIALAHYTVEFQKKRPVKALFFVTISLLLLSTQTPMLDKIGIGKLLPPKSDPAKKIVGWEGLGHFVQQIKEKQQDRCFVFADSYHIASELSFYMKPFEQVYYWNHGKRMTQFDLWKGVEQYEHQQYNALFISMTDLTKNNYQPVAQPELPEYLRVAFAPAYTYHCYIVAFRGKEMYQYHIYELSDFKKIAPFVQEGQKNY